MKIKGKKIYLKKSSIHGIGVFASIPVSKGSVIEKCPAVKINDAEIVTVLKQNKTHLINHLHQSNESYFFIQGYGSLYNHSNKPNAELTQPSPEANLFYIRAISPILRGEEILINYGDAWQNEHGAKTVNPREQLTVVQALWKRPIVRAFLFLIVLALLGKLI